MIASTLKPSPIFESVKKNLDMLAPEEPVACCPNCGVQLDSNLQTYTAPDEATELERIKAGLASLSEGELTELEALLPEGKEYETARFVIGHLIRLKSAPMTRRAA